MTGRQHEPTPGFNAPLPESGPIVSKRTGPRRARVQSALGAPQKMLPMRRGRDGAGVVVDDDYLDEMEERPDRSPIRGIAITLLILVLLGTRGCGLLAADEADEPEVPPATTEPRLVARLPAPDVSTVVVRDGAPDE